MDSAHSLYGVECFRTRLGVHRLGPFEIDDGSIDGAAPLFTVKKKGFGSFVNAKHIRSAEPLWSLKRSKKVFALSLLILQ